MTPKPESETDPWKAAEDAVYDPFCEAEEAWGIVDAARAAEAAQHQQEMSQQAAHVANLEHMLREHGQFGDMFQPGGRFHKDAQLEPGSVAVVAGGKWLVSRLAAVEAERDRLKAALERLRDCDWTIGRGDRMDAVRDIARAALIPQGQSTDGETR